MDSVAVAALLAAAPAAAQSTSAPPNPTPTPAPAPAGDTVGPPQLRDFSLNGAAAETVPPATTAPTEAPAPAPTPRAQEPATTPSAGSRATPPEVTAVPAPARSRPASAAATPAPLPDLSPADLPAVGAAPSAPEPSFGPDVAPAPLTPIDVDEAGPAWWPWLAALVALGLGAVFFWSRRQRSGRERLAADHAELDALVATPTASPEPPARAARPATPPASPRPALPPLSRQPAAPAPTPPAPSPAPAPSPDPAPVSGGIVASGLKPRIEFELVPIRAEADNAEGAALTVEIVVINRGSAPARDVLVEAQLINAGPQVDAEVGRFFTRPAGTGDRISMIPPMSSVAVKVRLEAPAAALAPLVVEGRKLLVPLVAINAFYRWSGGDLSDSSSFLVGRGDADGGKMAPFRLDQGARSWSQLGARLHSSGLQP